MITEYNNESSATHDAPSGSCSIFNKNFKLSDADTIFVASSVLQRECRRKYPGIPEKGLARFQFAEAFVRLAVQRFVKSGEKEDAASAAVTLAKMHRLGMNWLKLRQS